MLGRCHNAAASGVLRPHLRATAAHLLDSIVLSELLSNVLVVLKGHLEIVRVLPTRDCFLESLHCLAEVLLERRLMLLNLQGSHLHLVKETFLSLFVAFHILEPTVAGLVIKVTGVEAVH